MEERDAMAVSARAWRSVDQLEAALLERAESGDDVGDTIGDVVQPGAALFEEAADGGVRSEGLEQLQAALPGTHEAELDALRFDPLAAGTAAAAGGFE